MRAQHRPEQSDYSPASLFMFRNALSDTLIHTSFTSIPPIVMLSVYPFSSVFADTYPHEMSFQVFRRRRRRWIVATSGKTVSNLTYSFCFFDPNSSCVFQFSSSSCTDAVFPTLHQLCRIHNPCVFSRVPVKVFSAFCAFFAAIPFIRALWFFRSVLFDAVTSRFSSSE